MDNRPFLLSHVSLAEQQEELAFLGQSLARTRNQIAQSEALVMSSKQAIELLNRLQALDRENFSRLT